MKFLEFKEKTGYSYREISEGTGIPGRSLQRLFTEKPGSISLKTAKKIVDWSRGEVSFCDLCE